MRISDWSSDVCSSDLAQHHVRSDPGAGTNRHAGTDDAVWPDLDGLVQFGAGVDDRRRMNAQRRAHAPLSPLSTERKCVVSGKSVSVRVDLGGRRLINKKQTTLLLKQLHPISQHSQLIQIALLMYFSFDLI